MVGWDHVMDGLVRLGFLLMESYGPRAPIGGRAPSEGGPPAPGARQTPAQRSCQLGARILRETFRAHDLARGAILDRLLNHVVTRANNPVSHYLGRWALNE